MREARARPRRGLQYAALPVAEVGGETRVLLVTSRETRRWVVPKGWAEEGLAPAALAAKEAYEEAGALGEVAPDPVGSYRYRKRLKAGRLVACEVGVYSMRVERLLEDWPEAAERRRRWFAPREAAARVREAGLATLLRRVAKTRDAGLLRVEASSPTAERG